MTGPSPAWNLVPVKGVWRNYDGTLKPGSYTVKIPTRVVVSADDNIVPGGTFSGGRLSTTGSYSLNISVPSTDDPDISPQDWQVTIVVTFDDKSATETYIIPIPIAEMGTGIDLKDITLPQNLPDP